MNLQEQIAKHFREVHTGGNWTSVNLRDTLESVTWEQASVKLFGLNSIAALTFHMNYFVNAVLKVLEGNELDAHDKYSFDHPPINSAEDWAYLLAKSLREADQFALLVEQLPTSRLRESFTDEKYGTFYSNLQGIIEHIHYHLGQIVVIKKILLQAGEQTPVQPTS
jgi:uncharacterized damage-inducible protein DinB